MNGYENGNKEEYFINICKTKTYLTITFIMYKNIVQAKPHNKHYDR